MSKVVILNTTYTLLNPLFRYLVFKNKVGSIKDFDFSNALGKVSFTSIEPNMYTLEFTPTGIYSTIGEHKEVIGNKIDLNRFFEKAKIDREGHLPFPLVKALGKFYSTDKNIDDFIAEYNKFGNYKIDNKVLDAIQSLFTMNLGKQVSQKIKSILGRFSQFKLKEMGDNYLALTYKNILFIYKGNKVTMVYNNKPVAELSPLSSYKSLQEVFKAVNLTKNDLHVVLELQIALATEKWDSLENLWTEDDVARMLRLKTYIENPKIKYELTQARMGLSVIKDGAQLVLRIKTPKVTLYLNTHDVRTVRTYFDIEEPIDTIFQNEKGKGVIKNTINFISESNVGLDRTQKDILMRVISKAWNRNSKL